MEKTQNEKKKAGGLCDREMLEEALLTEEYMSRRYNAFVCTCTTQSVRDEAANILSSEHKMHSELLAEQQNQGWLAPRQAEKTKTEQILKRFEKAVQ